MDRVFVQECVLENEGDSERRWKDTERKLSGWSMSQVNGKQRLEVKKV